MSRSTKVPEHKLRQPGGPANKKAAAVSYTHHPSPIGSASLIRAWPFSAEDGTPLAWWRMLPSDLLRDAELLQVRATLDGIIVLHGGDDFTAALRGDPTAAITVAFSVMPIQETTVQVDVAMSTLLRCALERNASAALVLAQVLGLTDLRHPFAADLAASWFAYGQRYSTDPRKFSEAGTVLLAAFRKHHRGGDDA